MKILNKSNLKFVKINQWEGEKSVNLQQKVPPVGELSSISSRNPLVIHFSLYFHVHIASDANY